ncbi:Uncharacterised protein [uncultured Anaerotruncus sp.]|uniref:Immunoglobulin n=1 Tax=uncultured Anaerotruncus sp. TaxID=905011 RepID=A0A6N2UQS9_9FIRM
MSLSLYERETVITFNEAEATARIYTYNKALCRKLNQLAQERPEDCTLKAARENGAVDYLIPKRWVRVRPPRVASEAQKAASREAIKKANLSLANPRPRGEPQQDEPPEGSYIPPNHKE